MKGRFTLIASIAGGIVTIAAVLILPVQAIDYLDNRNDQRYPKIAVHDDLEDRVDENEQALSSLAMTQLEKLVLDLKDACEYENDPVRKAKMCERYRIYRAQLCSQYKGSWLCQEVP